MHHTYDSVLPRLLLQGAKKKMFFKYQSHLAFSSVLPFLLPTHSVDCAVHLLLSHSRALLVSTVKPLYSEQSRDPKNVHYTGVFTQEG